MHFKLDEARKKFLEIHPPPLPGMHDIFDSIFLLPWKISGFKSKSATMLKM